MGDEIRKVWFLISSIIKWEISESDINNVISSKEGLFVNVKGIEILDRL